MIYLTLKYTHILSMTLLFGLGLGSAFYKWLGDKSGNVEHIARTNRNVVLADWLVTTPTIIYQPLSGVWMAHMTGWPLSTPWLAISIILFLIAGCCWLPVVWLQIRMRELSDHAVSTQTSLPPQYWLFSRIWFWLGVPAFVAMLAIMSLMVFKPSASGLS